MLLGPSHFTCAQTPPTNHKTTPTEPPDLCIKVYSVIDSVPHLWDSNNRYCLIYLLFNLGIPSMLIPVTVAFYLMFAFTNALHYVIGQHFLFQSFERYPPSPSNTHTVFSFFNYFFFPF